MFASNEDHTVLEMIRPPAGSKVGESHHTEPTHSFF